MVAMADKKPKRPRDPNQLAKLVVDIATGEVKEAEVNLPPSSSPARARKGRRRDQ